MISEHREKSAILVVDDKPDDLLRSAMVAGLDGRALVEVLHPSDIKQEHLDKANLVLVDYKLDHWLEPDKQSVALRIQTGMALAAVLREVADETTTNRMTAFALQTGHLHEASGRIRLPHKRHVVARLNNLEWVFEKADAERFGQMVLLAQAAQQLSGAWPSDEPKSIGRAQNLLGMNEDASWFGRCWRDVRECQPPIHELPIGAAGVLFLRWLLHQILPYPCFLWDAYRVAARLRMHVDDLERLVKADNALARDLQQRRYTGILAGFLGNRWWRSAIEDYAWELADSSGSNSERSMENLCDKAGENLDLWRLDHPVVCLDDSLQPSAEFISASDAVNLRPDHWPAFADAAWMKIATMVADPALRAMVDPLDEYRLPAEDG